MLKNNENKNYSYNINTHNVVAPVRNGDVVGDIEIVDNTGKVVSRVDLIVKEDIDKHNFLSLLIKTYKNIINGYL